MTAITPFEFKDKAVRTTMIDGEPWFVGKDVCDALGIRNSNDAMSRLADDEKDGVGITDPIGRDQKAVVINEPGVYRLIMTSRVKAAEDFKLWLCHEVLPTIRKTGSYHADPVAEQHQRELDKKDKAYQALHNKYVAALEKSVRLDENWGKDHRTIKWTLCQLFKQTDWSIEKIAEIMGLSTADVQWMKGHFDELGSWGFYEKYIKMPE